MAGVALTRGRQGSGEPASYMLQARSVVGGVFLRLLYEPAVWKKWAGREKTKAAGWAGLPLEK